MKILIGTPIHSVKDYCFTDWVDHLKQFDSIADVFLVDNSIRLDYIDSVKAITSYETQKIEVYEAANAEERIALSRDIIRQKVIDENYDYWFSLESDIFVPSNTLDELLRFGNEFHAIHHSYPSRHNSYDIQMGFGCSLIKREALVEFGFTLQYGKLDPLMSKCYHGGEAWFNHRIVRNGWKFCDLHGVVKGIKHIADPNDPSIIQEV